MALRIAGCTYTVLKHVSDPLDCVFLIREGNAVVLMMDEVLAQLLRRRP